MEKHFVFIFMDECEQNSPFLIREAALRCFMLLCLVRKCAQRIAVLTNAHRFTLVNISTAHSSLCRESSL